MVNKPLIRPYFFGGGVALGGVARIPLNTCWGEITLAIRSGCLPIYQGDPGRGIPLDKYPINIQIPPEVWCFRYIFGVQIPNLCRCLDV